MREIKFRGKHKNPYGDKWVHGYYALKDGEHIIIMPHSSSYENALKEKKCIPIISVKHTIDYNTLGQYTGLKDKNGKEIFEGDIVKANWFDKEDVIGEICFSMGCFILANSSVSDNQLFIFKSYEVIGNIYDNPELLKED